MTKLPSFWDIWGIPIGIICAAIGIMTYSKVTKGKRERARILRAPSQKEFTPAQKIYNQLDAAALKLKAGQLGSALKLTEIAENQARTTSNLDPSIIQRAQEMHEQVLQQHAARRATLTRELNGVSALIAQQKFDELKELVGGVREKATKAEIPEVVIECDWRESVAVNIRKLLNLLKISNRIKLNDIALVLGLKRETLTRNLTEWEKILAGFHVDGENLVVDNVADLAGFMAKLDLSFQEWEAEISKKSGKKA